MNRLRPTFPQVLGGVLVGALAYGLLGVIFAAGADTRPGGPGGSVRLDDTRHSTMRNLETVRLDADGCPLHVSPSGSRNRADLLEAATLPLHATVSFDVCAGSLDEHRRGAVLVRRAGEPEDVERTVEVRADVEAFRAQGPLLVARIEDSAITVLWPGPRCGERHRWRVREQAGRVEITLVEVDVDEVCTLEGQAGCQARVTAILEYSPDDTCREPTRIELDRPVGERMLLLQRAGVASGSIDPDTCAQLFQPLDAADQGMLRPFPAAGVPVPEGNILVRSWMLGTWDAAWIERGRRAGAMEAIRADMAWWGIDTVSQCRQGVAGSSHA